MLTCVIAVRWLSVCLVVKTQREITVEHNDVGTVVPPTGDVQRVP